MLACSACRHILPPHVTICPNCGLALTASALPVVKQRKPIGLICVAFFALFVILLYAIDASQRPAQERADAAASASQDKAIQMKMRVVESLNSPASFEARCGHPLHRSRVRGVTTLIYRDEQNADATVHVTFAPHDPVPRLIGHIEADHSTYDYQTNYTDADGYQALIEIGCTVPHATIKP